MKDKKLRSILGKFDCQKQRILKVDEYEYEDIPDQQAFVLHGKRDTFVLLEIYSLHSLKNIIEPINDLGQLVELFPVKKQLIFERSKPVLAATVYKKPADWEEIQKYAADQEGSYYFYFLAQIEPEIPGRDLG